MTKMPNFAIVKDNAVVNVIVATSQGDAESATGMQAVFTDGVPWIGWTLHGEEWRPPMPAEGVWEWSAESSEWIDVTPEAEPEPDPVTE